MTNPTPDALKSLYFPALNTLDPAEDYDGGIPIRGVENGLQGTVPAWLDMDIGDRVDVFWNNATQEVWSKTIQYESELNRDVIFTLAKDFVLDGDATNVYYKISGKNYPGEESRPRLKLLVKLTRPGEYDDIPGDDGHSDLNFSLDRYEVDQDFPQNGVVTMRIVPYRNLTRYDRIHARWGSQQVMHLVTPEQAADPLKNPIDITFDYDLIKAAGDGSAVAVAFQVVDRCGNYPDERAPWSALQSVLVDMNGDRLNPPLVLVKGQPTTRVDLDELGDDDVKVHVSTPDADFDVGDEVLLTWTGTPAQGPQIIVGPLSMAVKFVNFHLEFIIPNEAVRAIAKGSASVGFIRRRENESDRPSKNASVSVVGDISRLPAPSVAEAPGGTLPVDTPWATVSAPWYVGRNGSDLLNVIWEAKAPGGDTVYYEDPRPVGNIADGEPVLRAVAQSDIQRFDGLSVKVYYVVTNSEATLLSVRESLSFIMQVGVAKPIFERPEVEEADANDVLDPDKVPPTGATLVAPFLGTQDKDRVTFYWRGSASGGSTSDHINLIPATAGKPVRLTVPKQYVTANLNGTVVADYKIERGGETLGHSQELKLRIGVALDLKEPKIKEAPNDTSLDPLNAQNTLTAVIDYDGMLVGDKISVRWTGAPGTLPAGSHTTDPWPVTRVGPQEIPLAVSVIAFNLDKSITLDYAMTRGTQEPKDSQTRTLAVLPIAQSHLPKPLITQASEAGEGSELDVSQLTTNATLRANSYPHIALRQYVWLKAKGTLKGGGVYSKTFWQPPGSQTNATWINQGFYTLAFPLADLQSLEDGHDLELEFKAGFGGTQVESEAVTFALRTYKIKATLDLQPPTLVAPAEDPIDVLAHPEGVTVRIEFRAALSDDQAGLEEVNPPVGSPQFPLVAFNSNKQVDTVLSPAFLAARHDTLVELFWSLYRNNAPAGKSDPVKLRVLKITDGDSRLPSPSITQAPDGKVLDLNEFEGNAEIIVLPWIGISTDNIVQLKLSGKDNNSSDHTIPILTNHKITDTEKTSGIKETLTREQLLTLKHDTEFKALFEVMPSATSNLIPIIFPALNLNLLKPPLVTSEDFETGSVGNKPVGTVMDFPSMTVTVVAGEVIIGVNDSDFTPHITAKYLYIAVGATLRLTLKQPARSIRFGIADSNRIPSQYKCYDENLQLVKAQSTPPYDGQNQVWADITETQNRQIKYIDITDGGGDSYLDNFSIFY